MISIRMAVLMGAGILAGSAASAAEAAKQATGVIVAPKTNVPVAKARGVGIPGEILFTTPSFEATWQDYRGRLALFSLVDKRSDEPLLISQDAFTITFASGAILRSSQMNAGGVSLSSSKANPAGATAAEKIGGKQASVSLTDEDGRITAKWAAVAPEGGDTLYQTLTLSAAKDIKISAIDLIAIQLENAKAEKASGGAAAATDTIFLGVKHPNASVTIDGVKIHVLLKQDISVGPGRDFDLISVIGATEAGKAADSFKAALEHSKAAAAKPAPAPAKKEEQKADKKEAKKEEKKAEPKAEQKAEAKPAPAPMKEMPKASDPVPRGETTKAAAKPAAPAKTQPAPKPIYKFPDNVNANTPAPAR